VKKYLLFLPILCLPLNVFGAAFLIYNQDAKVNGMGMAGISSVDNPSAVFYNPALLVNQRGFSAAVGNTMICPNTRHENSLTGKRTYAKTSTHHIPSLYIKYTENNFSFGVGVFSLFGLSTEWPENWSGRYLSTFAEIKTTYINPVFAYKINDYLSFGGGISYIKSSVKMKNAVDLSMSGLPDGTAKLAGDGEGAGYNLGITLKLPDQYTVSLTYRSSAKIKYRGKAYFYLPSPLSSSSTKAAATFTLPFVAVAGVSKQIGALTLEGDVLYTGWSSMSSYRVSSENGSANAFYYKDWRNTPSIAFGANYRLNEHFEIRGGYMFDKSPVPAKTLGPELPDSTRHIYTLGATCRKNSFKASIGYQTTFFNKVRSYLPGLNGTYRNFAHVGFISFEYNQ
jgi:long-chain fatty acid transport protein